MDIISILAVGSYCAAIILLLTIPLRRRAVMLRAGDRIFAIPFRKRAFFKAAFIVFLGALIIYVTLSRMFSLFVDIAFCGTALLGIEFAARQFALMAMGGAWQNAVIVDTETLLYDEIEVFPILQLPPEEQKNYSPNVLIAQTKSRGAVQLIFPNAEICRKVLEVIFTQCPDLKPQSDSE